MTYSTYQIETIALAQLETALRLYLEREDLISALTLAGAAEEILGKMLKEQGRENSLESLAKASSDIHRIMYGDERGADVFAKRANRARNRFKHYSSGQESLTLDLEVETRDMLDRAVSNYWLLEFEETSLMKRFMREQREEQA